MTHITRTAPLLAVLSLSSVAMADQDLTWDELPQAVQQSVLKLTQGAPIDEIEREGPRDNPHYEIEYRRDQQKWEIEVAEDGRILRHGADD